ncbi:MAG: hypothetical protein WBE24_12710, partial [Candidatus Acidiferrum sp.]
MSVIKSLPRFHRLFMNAPTSGPNKNSWSRVSRMNRIFLAKAESMSLITSTILQSTALGETEGETGKPGTKPGNQGKPGTGTCEEIDLPDFPGDPKCIAMLRTSLISVLNDKFLDADSVEIANL